MTKNYDQKTLTRLQEEREKNPALAEVIDLQHDLLEAQMGVQVQPVQPHLSTEKVRARIGGGSALLHPQELALDWQAFAALYAQVCDIAARHRSDLSAQFGALKALPDQDPDRLRNLALTYLEQGQLATLEEGELAELLAFVLNHTLRPFLRVWADALAPLVEQDYWKRRHCPVCAGDPDFAFLDEEAGARHLVCGRCDSQWSFPRIRCPFCNTSDAKHLSYYPSEDELHRLYVCRNCQRYLKTVDLRRAGRRILFPVERVTTIGLDVAAREEGYR